ncbi:TDT family transporter [Shewanella xiamenensis]|uniref:TDT family transporter n=1 Tax=Shewanella xiamenensis TaxID=332186 RepID=A0AAE4Q0P7_9GAMM|nr:MULTISPECIES: TDT family transporter [Shewanella]MCD8551270.1 TDT family transporter [Shewanella xiamenensis]MCD8560003.1 TDT family transporter [Shewanella xiamenensis]MCT8858774.1 TDT family transporter [Shewanella xiamenensis]MDH1625994.1 TDT family transporter [Shewanella xiamenensis]MDV5249490.1 TDT family transporter [Shewanella xiamenensis]
MTSKRKRWTAQAAKLPSPMGGLALAIASLGWTWESVMPSLNGWGQLIGAIIASALLLMLAGKFLLHPTVLKNELSHPVVGSVIPTFAMALMVVSNLLGHYFPHAGLALWLAAIAIHIVFLGAFIYYRAIDFKLEHMVPSWFVPPIGIIVAAVSFPSNGEPWLVNTILAFGMIAYLVMLPLMLYRLIFCQAIPDAAKPTIAILAAPASLSLAGYLTVCEQPSIALVALLASIAILMTAVIYLAFFHLLKLPFSPGYAAFTFPMVIGATALFKTAHWLEQFSQMTDLTQWVRLLADFELGVATVVVAYVAVRYLTHYLPNPMANIGTTIVELK